ncbi:MAG: hypothetical protein OHK0048_18410 [Rhodoferax sp.]
MAAAQAGTEPLRVGVYENPPKLFMASPQSVGGILGELLHAMAQEEGWTIQPVPCTWSACLDMLAMGHIDLLPDVAYTPERAAQFAFHRTPALPSWSQLYQRPSGTLHSIPDLAGQRIAVVSGSTQSQFIQTLLDGFALQATVREFDSFERALEAAARGDVDAVALSRFTGLHQAARYGLEPTGILFHPVQIFYAAPKGRPTPWLERIDALLHRWQTQENSPYQRIVGRWMEPDNAKRWDERVAQTLPGLALVALLSLALVGALRLQVKRQTARLRASESRLNTILDGVDTPIYIKDLNLRYLYVNLPMSRVVGQPASALLGQSDATLFSPETAQQMSAHDERVLSSGERLQTQETWQVQGQPSARTFLSVKLPLRDDTGKIVSLCAIATDITERFAAEEAVHRLAFYDTLTGLPNRRLLQDRIQQQLARIARQGGVAALMFMDLDKFKDINDTLGHNMGDVLLQQVAKRMQDCLRTQDTLARQGGDEFVVMLVDLQAPDTHAAHIAQAVAQKLLTQLSQPFDLNGTTAQISVSIGVTLMQQGNTDVEALFKQADLAMYQSKNAGRNTVRFFNPRMQAEVIARTTLEADLRWALAEKEFLLHYQPQVDERGRLCSLEALLRWDHPLRGLIHPADFVPCAEDVGLIVPLGKWVLHQACLDLMRWQQQHPQRRLTVAVNVSARQFHQVDFVEQVRSALEESGAPASQLELELTESQLLNDVDAVVARMHALKALGIQLSLDDFGTGYSSLAQLKHLPLDQLKIDQRFVRDMLHDAQDEAIIVAIVKLGKSLGLRVLAEGVETQAQYDALRALGCQHFQGFYFGPPSPLRTFFEDGTLSHATAPTTA